MCLKSIHLAENASYKSCLSRLFRAISPIIPRKRALSQDPKSAIFISGNVFQTHPNVELQPAFRICLALKLSSRLWTYGGGYIYPLCF